MKKLLALVLVAAMSLSMVACGGGEENNSGGEAGVGKVAIITGTVSQGEEDFQAAEKMKAKYPDRVITQTYPDNFDKEIETTISNVVGLVSDPDVKVLVFQQAVVGATAAIEKAREINPDLLVICGVAGEDPGMISKASDIIIGTDEVNMGSRIPDQAKAMGAKTLVHYSFARHLASATINQRLQLMKARCEEIGLEFVMADAPDPLSDVGLAGAQQFILEDVPKKVEQYGKDTAFFSTNCGLQEPLIKSVIEQGAYYPQPCCPSPYHAFPGALGIEIPADKAGDVDYCINQIKEKVAAKGATGHLSTWVAPMNMSYVIGATEYGLDWIDAGCPADARFDEEALKAAIGEAAGAPVTFTKLEVGGVVYDNYITVLADYVTF